ncbi:MAG: hypothetical protein K2M05_06530, partial [Paramuribaculum sp.]|nr:hypothetical protein [Paramuribaculum sp.]
MRIDGCRIPVSMNKVGEYEGWRFYQSGIGENSSVLNVSRDPWGTGITYAGYILLGIGMAGFFFQKKTLWRVLLRKYRKGVAVLLLSACLLLAEAAPESRSDIVKLHAMQRPLASNLGRVLVYWNDRICPMQTLARDVAASLYNGQSYKGFTPEQILSGWLFYYDEWRKDYMLLHPELSSVSPYERDKKNRKLLEKLALIECLGSGEIFRIYPYLAADGHVEWLSLTGRRPAEMELEQWVFMQRTMPEIKILVLKGHNIRANEKLTELMAGQRLYARGLSLPSETKVDAERIYNDYARPIYAAIFAACMGLITIVLSVLWNSCSKVLGRISLLAAIMVWVYVGWIILMLWWISGHAPLTNGPETMLFMSFVALTGASLCRDRT